MASRIHMCIPEKSDTKKNAVPSSKNNLDFSDLFSEHKNRQRRMNYHNTLYIFFCSESFYSFYITRKPIMEKIIIMALVIFVRILNRPIKNQLIFLIVWKGIWFFVSQQYSFFRNLFSNISLENYGKIHQVIVKPCMIYMIYHCHYF